MNPAPSAGKEDSTRRTWFPACCLLVALLCACASRLQGGVYFDEHADFSKFETFSMATDASSYGTMPEDAQAAHRVARREILTYLQGRGYRIVDDGADLLIRFKLGRHARTSAAGDQTEGTMAGMQIMLVDPATQDALWTGWGRLTWRESMNRDAEIAEAVAFILDRYPPASP